MAFNPKMFLDFEGLSQYDELIKSYVQSQAGDVAEKALADLVSLGETVAANTAALEVLNGEGEGSVKKAVSDAVAALVDNAPETLDTLKELADWIASDETASAELVNRVSDNEAAIADLQQANEDLKEYSDAQDEAVYNSIQSITNLKIISLFPVKQSEDVSAAIAIAALNDGDAIELLADQVIADNITIDKSCYIDANGSTFAGTISIPADAEVMIENATFSNPVVMA